MCKKAYDMIRYAYAEIFLVFKHRLGGGLA